MIRMHGGIIHSVESPAAEALQGRAVRQAVFLHELIVELRHRFNRGRRSVHVVHLDIGDMPARSEQSDIRLWLMTEELRAPNPGQSFGGSLRLYQQRRSV